MRSLIFTDGSVRALLEGRKTQTRRVVQWPAWVGLSEPGAAFRISHDGYDRRPTVVRRDTCSTAGYLTSHVGYIGDEIWVKETWRTFERPEDAVDGIRFRADDAFVRIHNSSKAANEWVCAHDNGKQGNAWRSSMFMPKWASRITLRITDLKVQRLHDISEEDAVAEGLYFERFDQPHQETGLEGWWHGGPHPVKGTAKVFPSPRQAFQDLWDSINGHRAPWSDNPYVWAVTFEVANVRREELACPADS